jgi:SecD/SecF fusion protein
MNGQGKSLGRINRKSIYQKSNMIVLDDVVYSAPGVSTGPISRW